MNRWLWVTAGMLLGFVATATAAPSVGVLLLRKMDPYLYGPCGSCSDLLSVREANDLKDFNLYNLTSQTGHFVFKLTGPAGTTVTLFGARDHALDKGFLVIVKQDDDPVAVDDLEGFVPGEWQNLPGNPGYSGAFSTWYHPGAYFKNNIASVRWGRWWTELPPAR